MFLVSCGNQCSVSLFIAASSCADPEGEGQGVRTPTLKNQIHIGFISNTGPEPLEIHKATKPAFNVGASAGRSRHASETLAGR